MKKITSILTTLILMLILILPYPYAWSVVRVRGYTKRNGTYVAPHHRTNPDTTKLNNWSTKGNMNPYTGKEGTIDPLKASNMYSH